MFATEPRRQRASRPPRPPGTSSSARPSPRRRPPSRTTCRRRGGLTDPPAAPRSASRSSTTAAPPAARADAPQGAALESAPEPAIAARRFRWPGGGARRGRRWKSPGPKLMGTPFVRSTTRPRRSRRPSRATPITTSPPSMEPRGSHGPGANRATLIRRTIPSIMARDSAIEWTGHTFNPWWGCTKVSPACDHCYAETWARRTGFDIWGANTPRRHLSDDYWSQPLRWDRAAAQSGRRARVFCASMADVFEWNRTLDGLRKRLWKLVDSTPHLDWLLLTKRPHLARRLAPWPSAWPVHVWLGTLVSHIFRTTPATIGSQRGPVATAS